ncbi:reverse transcriptase (RNA-dependent DNA polymerase) [Nonomuraea fuscirosea]|uniref:Reverse transcriptase (RNA-dependent DNA polymerase) n=1 Tax=Nonomuraea fuscirosea TaxID=1291556 RepID=A0A2T0LJZ2_9ACTN|nr:reverse transcriptase (RNA-dependent DNA polymerase) [Nonomuraea fuscirosea]
MIEIHESPRRARLVRRVFIPKANGKLRPLGIPVITDRAQQTRVRNALEPEWEARFEPKSYGFRLPRSREAVFSSTAARTTSDGAKAETPLDSVWSSGYFHWVGEPASRQAARSSEV